MRQIGFRISGNLRPPGRNGITIMRPVGRRRLEDAVEDVFDRLCGSREFDKAKELLELLEKARARRAAAHLKERRIFNVTVDRLREKMDRLVDPSRD